MANSIRNRVAEVVRERGAAHVSRVLGVGREPVLSYLVGTARDGTVALIEQRAARLDVGPSEPAAS